MGWRIASSRPAAKNPPPPPPKIGPSSLQALAALAEQLGQRRRVNVLHPNPQSLFDGLHIGFANVGAGNLTFVRRDIVAGGRHPVRFSRVHDSRIRDNPDFGPGWRLSLAEELVLGDGTAVHVDASGARHRFRVDAGRYFPDPVSPGIADASIEVSGDTAVVRSGGGTRTFEQLTGEGRFHLVRVRRPDGSELLLSYRNGLLREVRDAEGTVFRIERRSDGRVASAVDRHGRTVEYAYDETGRLVRAWDMAANVWSYGYDARGRLAGAFGVDGEPFLRVAYDAEGRVAMSDDGLEHVFEYRSARTVVSLPGGVRHMFEQTPGGATRSYRSTTGVSWELSFDERHRVQALSMSDAAAGFGDASGPPPDGGRSNGEPDAGPDGWARTVRFGYGPSDLVSRIEDVSADGTKRREFAYDERGRLAAAASPAGMVRVDYRNGAVSVSGSNGVGADIEYQRNSAGEVYLAAEGGPPIALDRNWRGDVVAIREGSRAIRFVRDHLGQLVETWRSDGDVDRYLHDALGFRTRLEHGRGGAVRLAYDAAGNIVEMESVPAAGPARRWTIDLEGGNRVAAITEDGGGVTVVRYDDAGRAVRFETRDDIVEVAYALQGTPRGVSSVSSGQTWETEGGSASRRAAQADADLRTVLLHDPPAPTQPEYAVVGFDERTFAPSLRDPMRAGVPGLAEASRLVGVATWVSGRVAMPAFEAFHPPEYRGANGAVGTFTASRLPPLPGHKRVCFDTFCGNCVDIPEEEDPCQPRFRAYMLFGSEGNLSCYRCPVAPIPPPPPPPPPLPPPCALEISIEPDSPTISKTPAMPRITATLDSVTPEDATVSWTADISYDAGSGCWGGPVFSADAEGAGKTFSPYFGHGTYGGELAVTARCSAPGYWSRTVRQTVTVTGTQPTDTAIVAEIGTVGSPFDGADLRRIACHESGLTQFRADGMPLGGPADDIGIMQICWDRRSEHLWNWRSNVRQGRTTLDTSRDSARNHLEEERKKDGATPYTTQMWRKEAIHRYNAGTGSRNRYWEWKKTGPGDDDPSDWMPVALGGAPGYVSAVLNEAASCR